MKHAAVRMTVATFCGLTAAYALLAASSFTYHDFIRSDMFGISAFSRYHVVLYWIWLLFALADCRASVGPESGPLPMRTFAVVWTAVAIGLTVHPVLPALADDRRSLAVAVLALVPLLWLALIDHRTASRFLSGQRAARSDADARAIEGRLLVASIGSAVFAATACAVLAPVLMRGQFEPDLLTAGLSIGLAWNIAYHLLIFCAAFLILAAILRSSRGATIGRQYGLVFTAVAVTLSVVVEHTVCDVLGFDGGWRLVVAGAGGLTIAATWGALRLRRSADARARFTSGLDVFFGPPRQGPLAAPQLLPFIGIIVVVYPLVVLTRMVDWDFLLLKTGILVLWIVTFDRMMRAAPAVEVRDGMLAAVCLVPLAGYLADPYMQTRLPHLLGDPQLDARHVLDRYAVYSPSFRLADGLLRPGSDAPAFERFLRANTSVTAKVEPVGLDFVPTLAEAPQKPPYIFLFVVDTLRPDYLSPYNPSVRFTPRLDAFAADSLVFRNVFTRYGATGLSLPAIWSGAMGVHKQYVTPFWPMNTLEKLLTVNHYRRVMSIDVLMETLLQPSSSTIALDRGTRTLDYDFCQTLQELETKFPGSGAGDPPVFAYSSPQDLHLSNMISASVPAGEAYPGFLAPYASRVRRIDRCFGEFVDFLKRRDLYDRSVIVVTSDHGEMLGEEGRWGHAYYLFPQVLRVPLIVHLPPGSRGGKAPDLGAVSFSTDIAPTLYAALGYRPHPQNPLMGEPLVGDEAVDGASRRRGVFVAAASYSAVYAVIDRNGRRVYIVDAVKSVDYEYDRDAAGAWRPVAVTDGRRVNAQRAIREHIDATRRVYHMPPGN